MNTESGKQCENRDELLCELINEVERGCKIIAQIDDEDYRQQINGSSVGQQFRHNLDFVSNLIKGIETGRIDHGKRERDPFVEVDREYATDRFDKIISRLRSLNARDLSKSVLVRSEIDELCWLPSSIAREVEFTHSHTVHHHALIAEKLASIGVKPPENLGVAPSTLKYWSAKAA